MIASGWGFPSPRICGPRKQSRLIGGLGDVRGRFESARAPLQRTASAMKRTMRVTRP
jgi:hypothetical protein